MVFIDKLFSYRQQHKHFYVANSYYYSLGRVFWVTMRVPSQISHRNNNMTTFDEIILRLWPSNKLKSIFPDHTYENNSRGYSFNDKCKPVISLKQMQRNKPLISAQRTFFFFLSLKRFKSSTMVTNILFLHFCA